MFDPYMGKILVKSEVVATTLDHLTSLIQSPEQRSSTGM